MSCITCVPDSERLIEVVYFGQPVIGPRTGMDLAQQIKVLLDAHEIIAAQIESAVYDGAYHHDHIPEDLDQLLEVIRGSIHHAYDHMHKSALEDVHIGKMKEFEWLQDVTSTVCDCLKKFRTGKNHYLLTQICEELECRLAHLCTLPETRMANYKRLVYKNFLINYHPMIVGLDKIQADKCNGLLKDRQEADTMAVLRGKIWNKRFILRATGACDIYMYCIWHYC